MYVKCYVVMYQNAHLKDVWLIQILLKRSDEGNGP
jgi:hypothetical protein